MKNIHSLFSGIALLLLAQTAGGQTLLFSTAQNITGDTNVSAIGTALYGYHWNDANQTVNGVTFTQSGTHTGNIGSDLTLTNFGARSGGNTFGSTTNPYNGLTAAYKGILGGALYNAGDVTATMQMNGLTAGRQYLAQVFVNDARGGTPGARTQDVFGTNTKSVDYSQTNALGSPGQSITAYFTPSSVSASFTVNGSGVPQINAIQVRDVTNFGWWSGANGSAWNAATTQNFSVNGAGTLGTFATAKAAVPNVYFADTQTFAGATVTQNTVDIAAGGVTGADVWFLNNAVAYTVNSGDATGITGAGNVVVQGGGAVTFAGNHSYTGATVINSGTLKLSGAGRLNSGNYAGAITNNGDFIYEGTQNQNLSGNLSGTGTFTLNSPILMQFNGGNKSFGQMYIQQGTIQNNNNAVVWSSNTGGVDISSGAILDLFADAIYVGALTGAGFVQNNYGNASGQSGSAAYYEKLIVGAGNASGDFAGTIRNNSYGTTPANTTAGGGVDLEKIGTGTQTLSGANTYSGRTTVSAGTLHIAASGSLSNANYTFANSGGTLDISGIFSISGTGGIQTTVATGTGTININADGTINQGGSAGVIIGQNAANHNGILNVSGTYSQTAGGFILGNEISSTTTGTLNIENGGVVTFGSGMTASSASGAANAAGVVLGRNSAKGTINLNAGGTLETARDIIRGTGTGDFNFNGGTLKILANNVQAGLDVTTTVVNVGGAVVDTNGFNYQINNPMLAGTGTGGLTKSGTGTLTLTKANTYTGATTISGGTLRLSGAGQLGAGTYAGAIANSGTLQFSSSASQILSGAITGTGAVVKDGTGTLVLAAEGSVASTQAITVSAGTLTVAAGTVGRTMANSMLLNGGTVLVTQGNIGSGGVVTLDGGFVRHAFTTTGNSTLSLAEAVTADVLVVGGGGGGSGAFYNYYGGGGGGGKVEIRTGNAISAGDKTVTVGGGGLARNNAKGDNGVASSFNSITADGGIGGANGTGSNYVGGAGGTSGDGHIGGAGVRAASGGGGGDSANGSGRNGGNGTQWAITGAYYGGGGLGRGDAGAGTNGLGGGGTTNTGGGGGGGSGGGGAVGGGSGIVVVQYADNAGTLTLNGSIDVQSASTLDAFRAGGLLTVGGAMTTTTGTGGLTIASSGATGGTVRFSNPANDYLGNTTVNSGAILQLGAAQVIPNGSGKGNLAVDGTLDLNTFSETLNGLSGAGAVNTVAGGTPTLTVGDGNSSSLFDGVIQNTAGTLSLAKTGGGTLILAGPNTYAGTTYVNSGVLQVGNGGATGTLGSNEVVNNASLVFNRNNALPVGNLITGSGTVTQAGTGTTTLTNAGNNFAGTVYVNSGVLSVASAAPLGGAGGGSVQIKDAATLQYTGSVAASTARGLVLTSDNGGRVEVSSATGSFAMTSISGATSDFGKNGSGTFSISGSSVVNKLFVDEGTYSQTGGTTTINASSFGLEVDTGAYRLEAGTLRTDRMALTSGGSFAWGVTDGAGYATLTMKQEGARVEPVGIDRTGSGGAASGPVVKEGTSIQVTGNLTTTNRSILDLGPTYYSNARLYDNLSITGTLNLSAADDTLNFGINPYFLRPSGPNDVERGDWGTLVLVRATSITEAFDSITVGNDVIGWSEYDGDPVDLGSDPYEIAMNLPINTWYVQTIASGFNDAPGVQGSYGVVLFHYKVAGSVPEPASAGLMVAGALVLRALRRRK